MKRETSSAQAQIEEQKMANRCAVPYFTSYDGHRARLTSLAIAAGCSRPGLRLCVLGAGNCFDLDLAELARVYAEIHLVDLDAQSLERAVESQDTTTRTRLVCHAPIDLTGAFARLDAWRRMEVSPEEIMAWPGTASTGIAKGLPGPFDLVISACVLSQLHFAVLNVLSDTHRLYEPLRQLLNLVHLRTMALLIAPAGRGLLVTDLASNDMIRASGLAQDMDPLELVRALTHQRNIIHAVQPEFLQWSVREDPLLSRRVTLAAPSAAWHWHVGPDRSFLVCALELTPRFLAC